MVSSCKQTPNMDPPKGLSIAHWKALGGVVIKPGMGNEEMRNGK